MVTFITKSQSVHIHLKKQEEKTLVYVIDSRKDITCHIRVDDDGNYSSSMIYILVIAKQHACITIQTRQSHIYSNAASNLFVRSVLSDTSTLSFDGSIYIGKQLFGVSAGQRCDVLTLDSSAQAIIKPNLEILSDDVSCTHGATVGPVPDYVCQYFESRGISKKAGERLYANGFLTHDLPLVIDKVFTYINK